MIEPDWIEPDWRDEEWAFWDHGKDEIRIPDTAFAKLEKIVEKAKGNVELFRARRGLFECHIHGLNQTKSFMDSVPNWMKSEDKKQKKMHLLAQSLNRMLVEGGRPAFNMGSEDSDEKTRQLIELTAELAELLIAT